MKQLKPLLSLIIICCCITAIQAQLPTPPAGKKWVKIENMSDEFNGNALDKNKWDDQDPNWKGRKPGRFEKSSISVGGGMLRVTASKKTNPYDGWTHNGGMVRSIANHQYGYFETRMKGSKTFMSATFWLMTYGFGHTGCDRARYTELDIQETFGIGTRGSDFPNKLTSNSHPDKNPPCAGYGTESRGAQANLPNGSSDSRFYVYGCWWKSPTEFIIYLDGKEMHRINPSEKFNLPMYLRMVVETYDWNPPRDGVDGMNDSWNNRTTFYDWTRSWKLVDCNGNCNGGGGNPIVTIRKEGTQYAIDGGVGGQNAQNVYLWGYNANNVNQQWEEINRGNGYYSYKKRNTNFCLDGGNGGKDQQNLYIYSCGPNNQNQHWKKVNIGGGKYRLEKRNASGFSIDGNVGGTNGQNVYLWSSSSGNINQQWVISQVGNARLDKPTAKLQEDELSVYPNPARNMANIEVRVSQPGPVTLAVYNLQGKLLTNLVKEGTLAIGKHRYTWQPESEAKGYYLLKLRTPTSEKTIKLVIE